MTMALYNVVTKYKCSCVEYLFMYSVHCTCQKRDSTHTSSPPPPPPHPSQIIPPHDAGIAAAILDNLTPWGSSWDVDAVARSPLVSDPLADVEDGYFNDIQKHCHR